MALRKKPRAGSAAASAALPTEWEESDCPPGGVSENPNPEPKQAVWPDSGISHRWKSDPPSLSYLPHRVLHLGVKGLAHSSYPVCANFLPFLFPLKFKTPSDFCMEGYAVSDCVLSSCGVVIAWECLTPSCSFNSTNLHFKEWMGEIHSTQKVTKLHDIEARAWVLQWDKFELNSRDNIHSLDNLMQSMQTG